MGISALVAITDAVQVGFTPPSFSYQAMVLSFAEEARISTSPSLSKSAAKTLVAPEAVVSMFTADHVGFAAPSFSYHAMLLSL